MTHSITLLYGIVAAPFLYPVVMRVIATSVQPKRLDMARLGVELVKSKRLGDDYTFVVKAMLRDAYDFQVAIVMAFAVPMFAIRLAMGRVSLHDIRPPAAEVAADFEKFSSMHSVSIAAANPLFFLVCVAEIIVFCLPVLLFKGLDLRAKTAKLILTDALVDRQLGHCSI